MSKASKYVKSAIFDLYDGGHCYFRVAYFKSSNTFEFYRAEARLTLSQIEEFYRWAQTQPICDSMGRDAETK